MRFRDLPTLRFRKGTSRRRRRIVALFMRAVWEQKHEKVKRILDLSITHHLMHGQSHISIDWGAP